MSDVYINRDGQKTAGTLPGPSGPLPAGRAEANPLPAGKMYGERSQQALGAVASASPEAPRIRIDVPMGTSYMEIQESVFRQAWEKAGTQLGAAIALGITPDALTHFLRHCDRINTGHARVSNAWPGAVPVDRLNGPAGRRVGEQQGHRPASVDARPAPEH